jgi:hypothetical protein
MASEQKTVNLAIPADVYDRLEKEANAKGCSVVELIPDMLRCYRLDWLKKYNEELDSYLKTLPPTPYSEEDVPRLVKEVRKELAAARELESRP